MVIAAHNWIKFFIQMKKTVHAARNENSNWNRNRDRLLLLSSLVDLEIVKCVRMTDCMV